MILGVCTGREGLHFRGVFRFSFFSFLETKALGFGRLAWFGVHAVCFETEPPPLSVHI